MSKFLQRIFKIIILSFIFLIILVAGVTFFVDPNQFKGQIEQKIAKQTGYALKIQGPMVWRWFPMLSLELNQIRLEAPEPFKEPLIASKTAKVEAELLPLLAGKLFLNLRFDNLTLLLEKNVKGQGNWENLTPTTPATEPNKTVASPSSSSRQATNAQTQRVILNSLNIKNSQIIFKNQANHSLYKLTNLNLSAENLFNHAFQGASTVPVSLGFNLEDAKAQPLGNLALSSQCSVKDGDQLRIRNLSAKFTLPEGATTNLTGEAIVRNLSTTPALEGQLETKNLKLDTWLQVLTGASNSRLPSEINVKTAFNYQHPKLQVSAFNIESKTMGSLNGNLDITLGDNTARPLSLKGNFSSKQLKLDRFNIQELKGRLSGTDTAFTADPIDFLIAGTAQHLTLQGDFRSGTPRYSLTAESQGLEINHLLELFNAKNKIEGKARYQLKLATAGKNTEEWRRALSGQANIEINNGKFYGIDLITLLKTTQSNLYGLLNLLVNKQSFNLKEVIQTESQRWSANQSNTKASTPFNVVKATAHINSGTLKNPDLLIEHAEYKVTGEGTCDLNTLALEYHLAALPKNNPYPSNDKIASYLYSVSLPIKVTGTLVNLTIRPDLDTYTRTAFVYVQKHFLEEVVEKTLHKALEHFLKKPNE